MSKDEKRIGAMKRNPRDFRPEELEAAILAAGFVAKKGKKTDHRRYVRGGETFMIDFGRNPCHPGLIRDALKVLEQE